MVKGKGLPKKWFQWAIDHRKSLGPSKAFKEAWKRARGTSKSSLSEEARQYVRKAKQKKRRYLNVAKKKKNSKGGSNLLGTVEKISKGGVLLAPTIRALTMPNDKLGHFVLFNSGVNIRTGKFDTTSAMQTAIPILGVFLGWKVFHKANQILRRI